MNFQKQIKYDTIKKNKVYDEKNLEEQKEAKKYELLITNFSFIIYIKTKIIDDFVKNTRLNTILIANKN